MTRAYGFAVTYQTVTAESVVHGDYAESGFIDQGGQPVAAIIGKPTPGVRMGLKAAVALFNSERDWTGVEPDCWPCGRDNPPRSFTDNGALDFASNDQRAISLHLPAGITGSSAIRIARLVNCMGVT